jgi:hypothetical protein|nr:MAG TPA: hypothetical protein [Caudoviricetes sp.]
MSIDCFNISEEELNQMIQDMKKIDKNVLDHPQIFSQFQDSETVDFPDLDLSNIEGEKAE